MKVTLAEFMENLNPKRRTEFVRNVARECEVQPSALSQWKKRTVPKYARAIIHKYAPVDIQFVWHTDKKTKEAA